MELSSRILNSNEKGLILDLDTFYMDSINRIFKVAEMFPDKLKEQFRDLTKYQLIAELVNCEDDSYFNFLFDTSSHQELQSYLFDEQSDKYIPFYSEREDEDFYTDFGYNLESFSIHPLTWFVCKEKNNPNSYEPFADREIVLDSMELDDIIDIVKTNGISIIVVPSAEMVVRLATELSDVTIAYPTYGTNMIEAVPGAMFFKYYRVLDEHEEKNKLEVVKYNPIGRYLKDIVAMG